MTISVVLADDQDMVRQGFAALLSAQDDISVLGQGKDGEEAVVLSAQLRPDVVLLDVRMPRLNGLEAARRILDNAAAAQRQVKVLMLTTFDVDDYVYEALALGASGFLLKDARAAELVSAVRVVAAGEALLAPSVTRRLIEDFVNSRPQPLVSATRLNDLTEREREVLRLIARGMSNQEIAAELFIAEQTVKSHVSRVLSKLHLRDRAQGVVLAYETGLVQPGAS